MKNFTKTSTVEFRPTMDLSGIEDPLNRRVIETLFDQLQSSGEVSVDFWSAFEHATSGTANNTIVFSDLHVLANRYHSVNHNYWAYRVKQLNPYFVTLIRNERDEKTADSIDELMRSSYHRMSVFDARDHFRSQTSRERLVRLVQEVMDRSFHPDALKHVSWLNAHQSFLVEFNDGVSGLVSLKDLQLHDMANELIPDSVRINEWGNAAEMFLQDGELFDIDALVLKSFLSDSVRNEIRRQSETTTETVGQQIKAARKRGGLTQVELSNRTQIDQAILSKIETGKHLPRFDTLDRIAKGLGIGLSEVLNTSRE
ncbi:MAG: helix-turn-helix domain-containing protein [Bacteroidota bacterium]